MQHLERGGGDKCMEVDHFNCTLPKHVRNRYENLFLASRHCNGAKSDTWPSAAQQKAGMRFLNCCEEHDYGEAIFEDPRTYELWGATVAAKYHIIHCDLNRSHLVNERRSRAQILAILDSPAFIADPTGIRDTLTPISDEVKKMIPPITLRAKPSN